MIQTSFCGSVRCASDWKEKQHISRVAYTHWVQQHSFVEIDHEIFFKIILSLLLIQEGQLSISVERMCTSTGKPLRGLSLPRKNCG